MKLFKLWAVAMTLGLTVSLLVLTGCGGTPTTSGGSTKPPEDTPTPGGGTKTALKPGTGTIKGKVTFAGEVPDMAKLDDLLKAEINKTTDAAHCLLPKAGDAATQQTWKIGKDKAVGNVVVFLAPAKDNYFAFSKDDGAVKAVADKEVGLRQPYCAFKPHVLALFTHYRDKDYKTKSTDQFLRIYNDTNTVSEKGIGHNSSWGNDANPSGGDNKTIEAGKHLDLKNLTSSLDTPWIVNCKVHPFMRAYVWALNHPYVDVTHDEKNEGKEPGEFVIKNVPAGKMRLRVWHEAVKDGGWVAKDVDIEVKDGETVTKNFEVK